MDILNNSIVTDVDTEILDGEIDQISNYLSETHYFDNEQEEELELLVAKAMKLGELYERKKWQAAKAQAVPECKWSKNQCGFYDTSCTNAFVFPESDDTPEYHEFTHCPFCGGKLSEAQEST